ncbi:MAG TPA: hypothetical protein VM529_05560 [Gemmata sp.]|nr:hypothetical protein [Gemmata sp.]
MLARIALAGLLGLLNGGLAAAQDKKDEPRKGTATGVVAAKGDNWIEVKADGEEKARRYVPHFPGRPEGTEKATLELLRTIPVGTRVNFDWLFAERMRVMKIEVLKQKDKGPGKDDKKEEHRKGVVTGLVTAKGDNWIEVTADGEEKGRRYVPHWRGGAPADGGGPDKEMVATIKGTPLKARVRVEWEFEERARVVKLEVLKKPEPKKDQPAKEPRTGSMSGEVKATKEQGNNVVIEVLAPGEEKPRPYFVQWDPKIKGPIPEVLKAVKAAKAGDRVAFDWEATNHGPAIVKFAVLKKPEEKK